MFDFRVIIDILLGIYFGGAALVGIGKDGSGAALILSILSGTFFFLAYLTDKQYK